MKELSIREIQLHTLEIMKVIDDIARKNNLKYTLFYGSLIGAVRHKGFIPWDDDLDIVMPREDYNKLETYFIEHGKDLLPYKLFSYKTNSDYPFFINRICDTNYYMVADNEVPCGMGTFIDIYPFDAAGNGKVDFTYKRARFYSSMYYMKSRKKYVPAKRPIENMIKKVVYLISKLYTKEHLQNSLNRISSTYDYSTSEFVTCLVWGFVNNRPLFKKSDIEDLISVSFEDANFYIPKNYDEILTKYYGNYMELPPENERVGHHSYKIYEKDIIK